MRGVTKQSKKLILKWDFRPVQVSFNYVLYVEPEIIEEVDNSTLNDTLNETDDSNLTANASTDSNSTESDTVEEDPIDW